MNNNRLRYVKIPIDIDYISDDAFEGCHDVVIDICDYSMSIPTPTATPSPTPTPTPTLTPTPTPSPSPSPSPSPTPTPSPSPSPTPTPSPSNKLTGDIQELLWMRVFDANARLEDILEKSEDIYMNSYFGVHVTSASRIDWICISNGNKYSLFGISVGMSKTQAESTLGTCGWKAFLSDSDSMYFSTSIYPDEYIAIVLLDNIVTAVSYYVYID